FQAEDGIRDKLVTGGQTCALPIYEHEHEFVIRRWAFDVRCFLPSVLSYRSQWSGSAVPSAPRPLLHAPSAVSRRNCRSATPHSRSEERRVGKECRSRWEGRPGRRT